jgi:hypothetical protein
VVTAFKGVVSIGGFTGAEGTPALGFVVGSFAFAPRPIEFLFLVHPSVTLKKGMSEAVLYVISFDRVITGSRFFLFVLLCLLLDPFTKTKVYFQTATQMSYPTSVVSVIVLGCTVMPDGSPSDWLTDRLLAALQLVTFHQRFPSTTTTTIVDAPPSRVVLEIICSGAAVRSAITEASCMHSWLKTELCRVEGLFRGGRTAADAFTPTGKGESLSEDESSHMYEWVGGTGSRVDVCIVEESQAMDTAENLMYSLQYLNHFPSQVTNEETSSSTLQSRSKRSSLWLITSDFHLVRGATLCRNEIAYALNAPSHFVLENKRVHSVKDNSENAFLDPGLLAALQRGAASFDLMDVVLCDKHGGVVVHCLAAPTASLSGEHLAARRAREMMLLPHDIARQRVRQGNAVTCTAHHDHPIALIQGV